MVQLRDISRPPAEELEPVRRRSAAVDDDRPLLLGHGGELTVEWLGRVPYRPTWDRQNELA
ncbi:MAG: hypothetical protein ACRDFZ_02985, partial [Candidatus Limnocylindria bacterium]